MNKTKYEIKKIKTDPNMAQKHKFIVCIIHKYFQVNIRHLEESIVFLHNKNYYEYFLKNNNNNYY